MRAESDGARLVRLLQQFGGRQRALRAQVLGVLGAEALELLQGAHQNVQRLHAVRVLLFTLDT